MRDVGMELGPVKQEITVTGDVPKLNTTNANVASEVTGRQVVELPLNFRHVFGLASLNSSVNSAAQWHMNNNPGQHRGRTHDVLKISRCAYNVASVGEE
jgi:hypothetical protein